MFYKAGIFFFASVFIFVSCKVDPKISEALPSDNLTQTIPSGWPQPVYQFQDNPISEDKFILGRAIFYETLLSKDNSLSCASCHQNFTAFANADHAISHGILDRLGNRNSPGLFNLAWHPYFMHDGGSINLEIQPMGPIMNPVEMDESMTNIVKKLQETQKYRSLFKSAFGDEQVSSERILKTLAQFMGLMESYNSKFDYWKRGEKGVNLTDAEKRGYDLFISKCSSCHSEPLFSDFKFRNNGLRVDAGYQDSGRAHITGMPEDKYTFKTPSLRNIALTKPYMHDGRYTSLETCLNHYTDSILNFENIDPTLLKGISMTAAEKKDIISFLFTLTDYEFIKDKRFADPNFN
jgi:cytochrome c peroxidase